MAAFYCQNCNKEVTEDSEYCKHCGVSFGGIVCPACGYKGDGGEFVNGCPDCGYSKEIERELLPSDKKQAPARPRKREKVETFTWLGFGVFLLVCSLLFLIYYFVVK